MDGYYRILTPLDYGGNILRKGSVHWLRLSPQNLQKLIELGLVSEIKSPPLSEIPEMKEFLVKLDKKGITTLKQFLEAQYDDLKSIWRRKDHIEAHKQKLIETYLVVPGKKDCDNC